MTNGDMVVIAREADDASLVLGLRAGEGWASEAVWDRYAERVRRYFARSGRRSRHDVEDLMQDVFLRVFTGYRRIQKPASLRHFVNAVAINVLRSQLRYQQILDGIRTRERDAFVLRHLEGMSLEEVADRLNVSTSTAKRLIGRAAKKLSTRARRTPDLLTHTCTSRWA